MSSPPHSVPLEVLERILRLAFEPTDPSSFTPAPSPPRGTSHLLLLSRGVRELCLPHFFKTVSISQPSGWVTLFGKDAGVLVVGEEGRRRWEWVEELNIVVEALIPVTLRMDPTDRYETPVHIFDFSLPALDFSCFRSRSIPRLIIHHHPAGAPKRWQIAQDQTELTTLQLGMLIQPRSVTIADADSPKLWAIDPHTGAHIRQGLIESDADRAQRLVHEFKITFENHRTHARSDIYLDLLESCQFRFLRLPADFLDTTVVGQEDPSVVKNPGLIEFCADEAGEGNGEICPVDLFHNVQFAWAKAHCRLVGFSDLALEKIETYLVEQRSFWLAGSGDSTWAWTRADGSEFTIDFAAAKRVE